MIIYEVSLEVPATSADAFQRWLHMHVQEMLSLPGFASAEVMAVERDDEAVSAWCVHYRMASREAFDDYLRDHAERMRADGLARFGDQMTATRRILHPALPD